MTSELQSVINAVGDLPPMPIVAVKVVELLQSPRTTTRDLAAAISLDPAVSARVLKIANSSFYSLQRQVKTLERAIVVLGEKTLRSLVLAASLKSLSRSFGLMEKMLWEDSIGCAIGARMLARLSRSADPEEAFLGGLFRHIGKLVMNNLDGDKFRLMVQAEYNGEGTLTQLERDYFPYSHAVIGAAVLSKWNFSENLVLAVRHHSDLSLDPERERIAFRLAATVNLAGALCRRLGIGCRGPQEFDVLQCRGARALGLRSEEQLEALLQEFTAVFEKEKEMFIA